jgi:membrane-associated phospholipid phosphatase
VRAARRAALAASAAFLVELATLGWLRRLDSWCATLLGLTHRGWHIERVAAITIVAPWVAASLALVAAAVAWRRRRWATLRRSAVVALAGLVLIGLLKGLLDRARPIGVWGTDVASFPSGHVGNAALLCGVAVQLLAASATPRRRRATWLAGSLVAVALVAVVGWSRLFLARHWLTDVVGAVFLAIAILASGEWLGRPVRTRTRALGGSVAALAALGLLGVVGVRLWLPAPSWSRPVAPARAQPVARPLAPPAAPRRLVAADRPAPLAR